MTSVLIKPLPQRDFYVYWSYSVDGILFWGNNLELAEANYDHNLGLDAERFNRADTSGTSSLTGMGGWDTHFFFIRSANSDNKRINREDIETWTTLFDDSGNDTDASNALLQLFSDEDSDNHLLPSSTDESFWLKIASQEISREELSASLVR